MNLSSIWGLLFHWPKKPQAIKAGCGHTTALEGTVTVGGKSTSIRWQKSRNCRQPDYCLNCLEEFSTNCQSCGGIILLDSLVLEAADKRIIGMCCAEMGRADATGRWTA